MKRKRLYVPGSFLLKWHTVLFVAAMVAMWLSVLATFEYPANAGLPFEIFKPFLISRISINILWGFLLLAHVGIQQLVILLQLRDYQAGLASLEPLRRVLLRQPVEAEALAYDEDQDSFHIMQR